MLKQAEDFGKRKSTACGLRPECKECRKQIRLNNLEESKRKDKEYRDKNKEKRNENAKIYYRDNIEQKKNYDQKYYYKNKKKIISSGNERNKKRRATDPNFKIRGYISRSICNALKKSDSVKSGSCLQYLPYTVQELKEHLESQFEPWMTWENWGMYKANKWDDNDSNTWKWNLDHIVPHSTFAYTSMEEDSFKECWKLDNLRPYSAKQNILDGVNRTRHNI